HGDRAAWPPGRDRRRHPGTAAKNGTAAVDKQVASQCRVARQALITGLPDPYPPAAARRPPAGAGTSLARFSPAVACDWRPAPSREGAEMFYWAAVFLVIALVAGVLGFGGIAGVSSNIAWILFVVGLIVAVVLFLRGRAP